jgi:hypothetical protein
LQASLMTAILPFMLNGARPSVAIRVHVGQELLSYVDPLHHIDMLEV